MNRKKIIRSNSTRKTQNDKLKEAMAKIPTAALLQKVNLEDKQKIINERLMKNNIVVRNNKSRRKIHNTNPQLSNTSFMEAPIDNIASIEWSTPEWFRTKEKADVSVIIPLYKSDHVIVDLINSITFNENIKTEYIFVDDHCPNNSKEVVLSVWGKKRPNDPIGKIIYNLKNKGYGGACNIGAKFASGKHLIFLNADTKVTKNWIKPMIDLFQDPKVGIVGNLHLKEGGGHDNTIDSAGSEWRWDDRNFSHIARHSYQKRGLPTPFKLDNAPKDILEVREVEMTTGCCFTITKELFDYIGGFNPNYRIGYWEDAEICLNVKELGYKVMFQPNSIIYHKLGHSNSGGHKFFSHNKQYFVNKWIKSHRIDKLLLSEARNDLNEPVNKILIKRSSSHGDILVSTGVVSALKKMYPNVKILFATLFPEVIQDNPNIDEFINVNDISKVDFDVFYNLDLCYEWRPNVNFLNAYAEACGVKVSDCKIEMATEKPLFNLPDEYVVVGPSHTNWVAGRDLSDDIWREISQRLLNIGEKVVSIGKYSEAEIPCTIDARKHNSIAQTAYIISKAKMFLSIDSFLSNIAQVFDIPGITFFGCINPKTRIFSKKMQSISVEELDCLFCHNRESAPPSTTLNSCKIGTNDCCKLPIDYFWDRITQLLYSQKINLL